MYDGLPRIVVTDEFRAAAEVMDFTQMTDDKFIDWLLGWVVVSD